MTRTQIVLDGRVYASDNIGAVMPLTEAERRMVPSLDKAKAEVEVADRARRARGWFGGTRS